RGQPGVEWLGAVDRALGTDGARPVLAETESVAAPVVIDDRAQVEAGEIRAGRSAAALFVQRETAGDSAVGVGVALAPIQRVADVTGLVLVAAGKPRRGRAWRQPAGRAIKVVELVDLAGQQSQGGRAGLVERGGVGAGLVEREGRPGESVRVRHAS